MDLLTNLSEEIDKAIGAHGMWKNRLNHAIQAGSSDYTVAGVKPDNLCAFGKWLHGLPPSAKDSQSWNDIRVMHAEFHAEAARVLDLALDGKKAEATSVLATGSRFADTFLEADRRHDEMETHGGLSAVRARANDVAPSAQLPADGAIHS